MKQRILLLAGISIIFFSCSKDDHQTTSVASFNFVNAVTGSSAVVTNLTGTPIVYSTSAKTNYAAYTLFSPVAGNLPVSFARITDTTHALFQGNIDLQRGNIYSFFISGDTLQVDTLLLQDHIPYYGGDSVTGVRLVNLSKGLAPVSVNVQGTDALVMSPIGYRQISNFQQLPSTSTITSYPFEVKDAAGNVLLTYTFKSATFRNTTLALVGSTDPLLNAPLKIVAVPNY